MILYFTGTGNSEYAARRIESKLGDETINLFDKIKKKDFSALTSRNAWVVVVPTYAWRIPRIAEEYLRKTTLAGSKEIYFVMTCGQSIGNAGKYVKALCREKNMEYMGCRRIVMPENYIAMFKAPSKEEALGIIQNAESVIEDTARIIEAKQVFPQPEIGLGDTLNSSIVNRIFYPLFVHSKKFYTTDSCIACGICADVCPLSNIHLDEGKPVWGSCCTHCMACISRCPKEAIEYGKNSVGKVRYTCPKQG